MEINEGGRERWSEITREGGDKRGREGTREKNEGANERGREGTREGGKHREVGNEGGRDRGFSTVCLFGLRISVLDMKIIW